MAGSVEELITMLYEMVQDARSVPLSSDKCVLERDKVLDLLDEVTAQLPAEIKQARGVVENRQEIIAEARKEAETIRKQAEDKAKQMVSREEIFLVAKRRANDVIMASEAKSKELRRASNEYVEDSLRKTEEALAQTLVELRQARSRFRASAAQAPAVPVVPAAEETEKAE
ncbi:MAG: hypothetical protein IJP23_04380 [Oscillospiraceae bacterium]|nr:hypothetical protein [Oscillospiraceae bacterium]